MPVDVVPFTLTFPSSVKLTYTGRKLKLKGVKVPPFVPRTKYCMSPWLILSWKSIDTRLVAGVENAPRTSVGTGLLFLSVVRYLPVPPAGPVVGPLVAVLTWAYHG